jgi:heme-degrading monooxygenase HmoA
MISRHWRGVAKPECAEAYIEHLRTETIPAIAGIAGFVAASILRRPTGSGVEFLVITRWSSIDAIREFAGAEPERAVVPAKVRDMMVDYDLAVLHYEVVD